MIKNYTTSINPSKTIGEIQEILSRVGISKFMTDYDSVTKLPTKVTFAVRVNGADLPFSLPANIPGIKKHLIKHGAPGKYCTDEHATRVAWRILKDWIDAQMAIIEADLVTVQEVFFPYLIVNKEGDTVYQSFAQDPTKLLK